jgi:hypothetical protein
MELDSLLQITIAARRADGLNFYFWLFKQMGRNKNSTLSVSPIFPFSI